MKKLLTTLTLALFILLPVMAFAEPVTTTLTAENTWTALAYPKHMPENSDARNAGFTLRTLKDYGKLYFYISIGAGTTVSVKPIFNFGVAADAETAFGDVYTTSGMYEIICTAPGVSFIVGVETGDYGAETTVILMK